MKRRPFLSAAIGAIFMISSAAIALGAAPPTGVLDNECDEGNPQNGWMTFDSETTVAQTFVVGQGGRISSAQAIDVFRGSGGPGEDVIMTVARVDSTGAPTTQVLGSTRIPDSEIAKDALTTVTGNFAPANAPYLSAGRTYALGLTTEGTDSGLWHAHDGNPCAGGVYSDGSSFGSDWDSFYRIFVTRNKPPTIKAVRPAPGSETANRRPVIRARVSDAITNLRKGNMRLFVDGRRVTGFNYDRALNKLTFRPNGQMSFGRHDLRIVATDRQGLSKTKEWAFRIVRS